MPSKRIDPENPTLEDALDGLIAAVNYCESIGLGDVAYDLATHYQTVGREAPDDHWADDTRACPACGTVVTTPNLESDHWYCEDGGCEVVLFGPRGLHGGDDEQQ